jgi:uncharacterized protein
MNEKKSEKIKKIYFRLRENSRIDEMDNYIHHGNCSTLKHSFGVAYFSMNIGEKLGMKPDYEILIKSAIIHDYYLYDWHDKESWHSLHGFKHPKFALKNALEDFNLNEKEIDAITNHMFPLVPFLPKYKEGRILCFADKLCAAYEIFKKNPYEELYKYIKGEL